MAFKYASSTSQTSSTVAARRLFGLRLAIGLGQGGALTLLYHAAAHNAWPATIPTLFAACLLSVLCVPVLAISGLGHVRWLRLSLWLGLATLLSAGLGWHAMARLAAPVSAHAGLSLGWWDLTPSGPLLWMAAFGFFMAQSWLLGAATSSSSAGPLWRLPPYAACFEAAWKLALQVLLALLFVGILWLILWLGAELFLLLGLKGVRNLLEKPWFYMAVTASAFSLTLHVTDVRPAITASLRNLLLGLMSWLLPLAVVLVGGFLLMLPLTGLTPLWATKYAGSALLMAVLVLVVLANTVFQDGSAQQAQAAPLRWALRAACLLLLPITALAGAALLLRVQQYGWTAARISAGAMLIVAGVYALGYLWAALSRPHLASRLAATNLGAALLTLALLLALSTPLADPARLAVQHQLARLAAGAVTAQAFDYDYLRFQGERYGAAALGRLSRATGPDAQILQAGAREALRKPAPWSEGGPLPSDAERQANLRLWPPSATVPAGFLAQDWQALARQQPVPPCLTTQAQKCDLYLIDLNQDGQNEVLVHSAQEGLPIAVFQAASRPVKDEEPSVTTWRWAGTLSPAALPCDALRQAFSSHDYRLAVPRFQEIVMLGQRLSLVPPEGMGEACTR